MINRKKIIYASIAIVIINKLFFVGNNSSVNPILALNLGPFRSIDVMNLIPWFLNYSIIVYLFFGYFKKNFTMYGYLEVSKYKSKIRWLNKRILNMIAYILFFVILTQITNIIFNIKGIYDLDFKVFIISNINYMLVIILLLLIQGILEVKFTEEYASTGIMIFTLIGSLLGGVLYKYEKFEVLIYFLLPNNSMGYRNNLIDRIDFGINPKVSMIFLLICISLVYIIFRKVFEREDII
ncbi:MAG: DUF2705 family protein [Clostridium chrysemydis]|uniref:DUF2705 family protein n=1 Tax=Clostridium chrysemydis TaxID=2665504 RepID=UPI0018831A9D|nr:DUF2705 family protein [Clostridium chrysemydis]